MDTLLESILLDLQSREQYKKANGLYELSRLLYRDDIEFLNDSSFCTQVVPKLVEMLPDALDSSGNPDEPSPHEVIELLGFFGDTRAIPALAATFQHYDYRHHVDAAKALGNIGDPAAIPLLIALMNADDISVQHALKTHRSYARGKPALPQMLEGIQRRARIRHQAAADALEAIGTPEAIVAVEAWRAKQNRE